MWIFSTTDIKNQSCTVQRLLTTLRVCRLQLNGTGDDYYADPAVPTPLRHECFDNGTLMAPITVDNGQQNVTISQAAQVISHIRTHLSGKGNFLFCLSGTLINPNKDIYYQDFVSICFLHIMSSLPPICFPPKRIRL